MRVSDYELAKSSYELFSLELVPITENGYPFKRIAQNGSCARAVRRADSVSRRETRRADYVAPHMRSGACRLVE